MTLLRSYHLPETGEQLSCYIAPNDKVKLKLAGHGFDFIVGIGTNKEETIITENDEQHVTMFSDTAAQFCDAIFHYHTEGSNAFQLLLAIAEGGSTLPPKLKDFVEGWVLPC